MDEGRSGRSEDNSPPARSLADTPHLTGVGLDHWGDSFPSTHWSIMIEPPSRDTATQRLLERLCTRYWYPLYAYLRKRGHSSHDAQDLTQGFFSKMLEGDGLAQADRTRGRFRSYMIGALNHYLSDVRRKGAAEKRGGGRAPVSIDEELAERRFRNEPADNLTPEKLFDREWAVALLQDVVDRLRHEYASQGKGKLFDALSEFLTVKPEKGTYPVLAKQLGMSEGNVRVMVSRIRKRYKAVLIETIDQTVNDPDDAEDELQHLLAAFSIA